VIRYSRQKPYPWRRREEDAARDSNFREVIEVGLSAQFPVPSARTRSSARIGARSARRYGGRRNAAGATTANAGRRAPLLSWLDGEACTTPSAGLPAADRECATNHWRPGAVVERSGVGTRLDRRRQSGPVGGGGPPPRDCRRRACIALRCGHRTRVDSHKLVT
jgi:hypothetical protein